MTFATYETSAQSGAPIELYEFEVGPTVFRYSAAADDVVYLTKTFSAIQISRSDVEESGELPKDSVTITVPRNADVADLFRVAPPSEVVLISIYRMHVDDPDAQRILFWTGRVLNCEWKGAIAELTCQSIYTALKRTGLRRLYQRQCPHVLYGPACGLVDTAYKATTTLATVSGITITAAVFGAQADGYYAGGMIEWEASPGRYERRGIKSHVGTALTMTHPIADLPAGATVAFWPGCDHSLATCHSKFANRANYGGFPYVPRKNPFTGTNVY